MGGAVSAEHKPEKRRGDQRGHRPNALLHRNRQRALSFLSLLQPIFLLHDLGGCVRQSGMNVARTVSEPSTSSATASLLGTSATSGPFGNLVMGPGTPLMLNSALFSAAVGQLSLPSVPLSPSLYMRNIKTDDITATTSASSSEPELPTTMRQLQVPVCSICGADSTGIHFGCEACAACSAFFRRTVVLNKNYNCGKDGSCNVLKDSSQKCRACRFKKCLLVGMDRTAVQHRRDAIGKFSDTAIKRECESPIYTTPIAGCLSPPSPKSPRIIRIGSVLDEFVSQHAILTQKRKIFYTSTSLNDIFDTNVPLQPTELSDFGEAMYQLWRIEPRLCAEFISDNKYLAGLPPSEKSKMFKHFMLLFQAIEEPYLTWKFGGLEKKWWIMPNRTYIDFNNIDEYFDNSVMKSLNLDKNTAMKLFLPSFQHAMDLVGAQMALLDISLTEMVALVGILMLEPCANDLAESTRELVARLRDQLIRDLLNIYEADDSIDFPEVRLGNLIFLTAGIKVHAQRCRENMQMLKVFDIVPRDKLFNEMVGIAPDD